MSRIKVPAAVALCAVLLGAVCSEAAVGEQRADRTLHAALARLVHMRAGPPGVAVVVQRGHRFTYRTVGDRDVRVHRRWRRGDHMRIASVSKAFSGAVALSLVDRGRLRLGDTIGELLPGLPAKWQAVTLGEALHHTSGLPDYTLSDAFLSSLSEHPRRHLTPRALIDFVKKEKLDFKPGSQYNYSNTDNIVVAMMARVAAHDRSYRSLLRSRVLDPLALRRTSLPSGFRLPRPFVHGYMVDPPGRPEDVSTTFSVSGAWASGGIQSTASNLNRFIRAYVGGRLFGHPTQRRQLRFVEGSSDPPGPGVNSAGLAIFRYRTRCGTVYGHTGSFPGYTQLAAATRSGRRSLTVSVNEQLGPASVSPAERAAFRALRRVETRVVCAALRKR
jgi:D-alanyl-D-alanine carboxypeptidase